MNNGRVDFKPYSVDAVWNIDLKKTKPKTTRYILINLKFKPKPVKNRIKSLVSLVGFSTVDQTVLAYNITVWNMSANFYAGEFIPTKRDPFEQT